MAELTLNPLGNLYDAFTKIINSITIKYVSKAQQYETMEIKLKADAYLDAITKKDSFFTYRDYTRTECKQAGIHDVSLIDKITDNTIKYLDAGLQEKLLEIRRKREIKMYEEQNNYYRMLNGYPPLEDTAYFYISSTIANEYDIDKSIPIHKIQDYYNDIKDGMGDYYISIIEGLGYIDRLVELNPDKPYLKYLGTNRISLATARNAKNFQIIQIKKPDIRQTVLDSFIQTYEQCRDYYMSTIYIASYSNFFDYYDNFIAMCIMLMTVQQLVVRQQQAGIRRDFFDINAVRALYEAYDVPFNLRIDEETQNDIVQNLNLLIQNKGTNKVLYNITNLLGFSNANIYKYYLAKEHRLDAYGVPIFQYTTRFNSDTGETETVPDYEAMYDLYFQKYELREEDFMKSFHDKSNRVEYKDVVENDPFWWADENTYKRVWETQYNFVESKYLSLGISYSMTEIVFENSLFLKLLLREEDVFKNLTIQLPRILASTEIPILDVIVLMLCLTAYKHHLYGEIITIPTQVIAVLDYVNNTDRGDFHHDTFRFNFDYFFHPDEQEDATKMEEMKEQLQEHMRTEKEKNHPLLVDTFSYNFDYFSYQNPEREERLQMLKEMLGDDDYDRFRSYVEKLSLLRAESKSEKIKLLNDMFTSIKGMYRILNYYLTKTDDREVYDSIKTMYNALFFSKEVADVFQITTEVTDPDTGEVTSYTRTAWTFFEFLAHRNPRLYGALFECDLKQEYYNYLEETKEELSYTEFEKKVANGEIFIDYGKILNENDTEENVIEDNIYMYINHIISRLEIFVDDLKFLHIINDSSTPLETLLMQMVRFFKSYTVDIIGLDTLYVCDFKPESTMRLFDEINRIKKTIQLDTSYDICYSDVIHGMVSSMVLDEQMSLKDKLVYSVWLYLLREDGDGTEVILEDKVVDIAKTIEETDPGISHLFDTIKLSKTLEDSDSFSLRDRVVKTWYTD